MSVVALQSVAIPGGLLLVLSVLLPFTGVLIGLVLGASNARRVAQLTILAGLGVAFGIAAAWLQSGATLVYLLGLSLIHI